MLSRHVHRLVRDWGLYQNHLQRYLQNAQAFQCLKCVEYYSWACYPHLNLQNFGENWRLPLFWNLQLSPNLWQNYSIHFCTAKMKSEDCEPVFKKRRESEVQDINCSVEEKINVSSLNEKSSSLVTEESTPKLKRLIKRHWEYFCHQSKKTTVIGDKTQINEDDKDPQATFDFTVMSYNILSQDLLEYNPHLYRHCQQQILAWNYRFPNILADIKQLDADVLCLQEVQEDQYGVEIKPTLEALGYHCEYKMRTRRKPDGCATCFKTSKFSLLSSNPVEFFRHNIPLLDRDNVGLVLLLQPRFSYKAPTAICVANTHLLYNPRRGDIKLTQLAILLAEITSVAIREDGRFCPLVLCGDFNSVPHSPLYNFLTEGKLNYEGLPIGKVSGQEQSPRGQRILKIPIWPHSLGISQDCMYEEHQKRLVKERESRETKDASLEQSEEILIVAKRLPTDLHHSFQLSSVYSHYLPDNGVPEVTTCHSRSAVTVDYIFYSVARDNVTQESGAELLFSGGLSLLGRLSLVTEQDLWGVNGLPNESNSSDHLPLLAKFRLEE
ncbi:protein angel homolog 2 [Thamnophis elegans]|uniref:protein angel homolog 2 n=1 Tax=Thamnophis elegans TaxID=35005 RepID=UPI001376717F|nr:protein angel homolog 2 [Thamnophis elegans]XP_032072436.1 protein angel homolog 2 [Thamnophis elegans]XP_032072437.1 protein angel homolog 2 [Thamnophis elegans]